MSSYKPVVLTPNQVEDATKMSARDLPNYSKPGTGKTVVTLEAMKRAKTKRGLILCPSIASIMWRDWISGYLGADAAIITSSSQKMPTAEFQIVSYGLISRGFGDRLYEHWRNSKDNSLVMDEAHYLRGYESARSMAVAGPDFDARNGLIELFDRCYPLTGTPIMRHNDDMWAQLRPLFPQELAAYGALTLDEFWRKFCYRKLVQHHPRQRPHMSTVASVNTKMLNKLMFETIGAINRQVIDGLEVVHSDYEIALTPNKGAFVDNGTVKKYAKLSVEECMKRLDTDESMSKVRRLIGLMKIAHVVDHIKDTIAREPLLIGVLHSDVGEALHSALSKHFNGARVYGATPPNQREEIRLRFNDGKMDYIVGQMAAMGTAWNLQECGRRVFILEEDPSPAIVEQFYKRVARTGQKNQVLVEYAIASHPVDKAIREVRERKAANAAIAMGE